MSGQSPAENNENERMRLVILSGLSGAGKSVGLRLFEDIGYYCIDNMPLALLPTYVKEALKSKQTAFTQTAISVDARTASADLLPAKVAELASLDVDYEIVFLIADHDVLLRRYSETRRKHPLTTDQLPLKEAIAHEAELLEPIAGNAQFTLDTTDMSAYDLRESLREYVAKGDSGMTLLFESFGFKHGAMRNADFIFDVRCLPNPFWEHDLREYSGLDQPVIDYLGKRNAVRAMVTDVSMFLRNWLPKFEASDRSYITIGIGCTGGQHRSVYTAERLAEVFKDQKWNVQVRHREMARKAELKKH